jgi:cytochrome c-type biogenesis protein CcmF
VFTPAISQYPSFTEGIGTPSVHPGLREDVYLTLVSAPQNPGDSAVIGVIVQPLVSWLWIGGAIMALGTALAAWPGSRRRQPLEPVSAPVPGVGVRQPAASSRAATDGPREPVGIAFEGTVP